MSFSEYIRTSCYKSGPGYCPHPQWTQIELTNTFLLLQSESELRTEIFKYLEFGSLKDSKNINFSTSVFQKVDYLILNNDTKWFLISLINNPKQYTEEFVELLQNYNPLYEKLKNKYWDDYTNFTLWIDDILTKEGIAFLDEHLSFINLKQYDEIYLNYSLFDLITSHILDDKTIHIYLGLIFEKFVKAQANKKDVDSHLNVYKVFADKTRFDIIKLLIEEESYGQEIAEKLGITTATVSYHMDYLFATSLIFIKRKGKRIYYSVNKSQIKNSLKFLEKEFNID